MEVKRPFLFLLVLFVFLSAPVAAQNTDLVLSLRRDFGYSFGSQIQGLFTVSVTGPANLASVRFELDGREITTVSQAPFAIQIKTDDYAPGLHSFRAVAHLTDGRELVSNTVSAEILTAEASSKGVITIIVPILGVILLAVVIAGLVQYAAARNTTRRADPSAPRTYGPAGGAICPHCGLPFERHLMGLNLFTGKLERCPYCGKWSIVPAASPAALEKAEEAARQAHTSTVPPSSAEDELARKLEDSKYE